MSEAHISRWPARRVWVAAALAVASVATVVVFALSARTVDRASAAAKRPSDAPDTVTLAVAQRASVVSSAVAHGDVPVHASVPGRIEFNANRVTALFAQFSGRVVRLDVEVGTPVSEGQTIAMLDSPDVVGMQADYQEALAAVRAARTSHEHAGRTRERASRLATVEAIPLRELQEAQLAETRAGEELQQAEARL